MFYIDNLIIIKIQGQQPTQLYYFQLFPISSTSTLLAGPDFCLALQKLSY